YHPKKLPFYDNLRWLRGHHSLNGTELEKPRGARDTGKPPVRCLRAPYHLISQNKPIANNLIMSRVRVAGKLEDLQTLEDTESVAANVSVEVYECLARNINASDDYCPAYHDGLLCWDRTPWNTMAVQKCFSVFHGVQYDDTQNATRLCLDGEWQNYTNYANCTERIANVSPTDVTSLIYLSGYSLSLGVLSLAVFVFLYFKDLRCLRNTIHTNLMSTYILSACSWILNLALQNWSDEAQQEQTSCMVLVICMHYFYLTNFFWMLVEGLYLYMLVVETFTAENIKLKVYTTIGW
ncbi:hypothetical protein ACJJTC_003123, partial [Scirpophaga incertulas]